MSMYIGVSGIKAATVDLNTTSHNIANASTTGFKNSRAEFGDLVDNNGAKNAGIGVKTQAVNQLFQQGGVITTGNALDLAIVGNGFFQVKDVTGGASVDPPFYTRAGSFRVDKDGFIVNNLGQRLQGTGGDLGFDAAELPVTNITIDKDGNVNATGASGASLTANGGPLGLADFPNVQGLKKVSDTTWLETPESGEMNVNNGGVLVAPGTSNIGKVMSGALEASNVDLTDQLVNMIIAQRNFQANAQTITTNNTLTQTIINIR